MLWTRFASPIFTVARGIPMVRMNRSIRCFCSANTCSTLDRIFALTFGAPDRLRHSTLLRFLAMDVADEAVLFHELLVGRRSVCWPIRRSPCWSCREVPGVEGGPRFFAEIKIKHSQICSRPAARREPTGSIAHTRAALPVVLPKPRRPIVRVDRPKSK